MSAVVAADWASTLADLRLRGFTYLDLLTAVDRLNELEILAHVVDLRSLDRRLVSTRIPSGGHIASITPLFAAAVWHERETAEMFGVTFDGHPDPRPLLLRQRAGRPPMLKSAVLAARAVEPWPGAAEPTIAEDGRRAGNPSRRAQQPPGVAGDWLDPR